jgi:RNA polymerase sigma factor (sigma-70 family)
MVEALIKSICLRYCRADNSDILYDYDDLCQSAYFGFLKAIGTYDCTRGAFSTHLVYHVRKSCRKELGLYGGKRDPIFDAFSIDAPAFNDNENEGAMVDTLPDSDAEQPFDEVIEREYNSQLRTSLDDCLTRITQDHATLLRSRYYDGMKLKDIAAASGTSIGAARRTLDIALRSVREEPVNLAKLKEHRQNIIDRSYRGVGYNAFYEKWYSSVEQAAEALVLGGW